MDTTDVYITKMFIKIKYIFFTFTPMLISYVFIYITQMFIPYGFSHTFSSREFYIYENVYFLIVIFTLARKFITGNLYMYGNIDFLHWWQCSLFGP